MLKKSFASVAVMLKYAPAATLVKMLQLLVTAVMTPLALYFTQRLVDSIAPYASGEKALTSVLFWAVPLLASMLFSANVNAFNGIQFVHMKRRLNQTFTKAIIRKYKSLDYACFEDPDIQDTLMRMGDSPQDKILNLFLNLTGVLSNLIALLGLALLFMQVSVGIGLAFLAILFLIMRLDFKAMDTMNTLFNNQTGEERQLAYLSGLLSDKTSLLELRIFGAVAYIRDKWYALAGKVMKERIGTTLRTQRYFALSSVCLIGWVGLVIFSLLHGISAGVVTVGLFVSLVGSAGSVLGTTEEMSHSFSNLSQRYLQMEHYDRFMKLPEVRDTGSGDSIEDPVIHFEQVVFSYPGTEKRVLNGVTFTIHPHEKAALVGENGAGKSTIIKLLCRLYRPDSGRITVNGRDLNDLSQAQLRCVLSVVFQDYAGYSLTLRENVAFGSIGKLRDDDAIRLALKQAMVHGVAAADEAGRSNLDASLGMLEEDGVDLSGGQWQRIAIARACIADSSFVILDEPTAALDPVVESEMYRSFAAVMKNKGCILISHRLASAKMCDLVLVLHGGTIVEQGSHEELMRAGGLYARLFSAQSAWYSADRLSTVKGGELLG